MTSRAQVLTGRLAGGDESTSLAARARSRRWDHFQAVFPDIGDMRVLDLGGMPEFWRSAPVRPARVTTVNLFGADPVEAWIDHVVGDACAVELDPGYDLVLSNSLLEHLGGHTRRERFADVVRAAAPRYWVQTPYRYFPIEPHWLFPGLQFLPFPARVAVTRHWRLGYLHRPDHAAAVAAVHEIELVGIAQLRSYFPDGKIWLERFAGLPKSLVAVRP